MTVARVGSKAINDPWAEPYDFFSAHPTGANFLFADGAVHFLRRSTAVDVLHALATRGGDEPITPDW